MHGAEPCFAGVKAAFFCGMTCRNRQSRGISTGMCACTPRPITVVTRFPAMAGLAQLVEHLICNQRVAGSSPAAGTIGNKDLGPILFHILSQNLLWGSIWGSTLESCEFLFDQEVSATHPNNLVFLAGQTHSGPGETRAPSGGPVKSHLRYSMMSMRGSGLTSR